MLGFIDQAKLDAAARDEAFLAHLDRVTRDLDAYISAKSTWYGRNYREADGMLVAYFSAEFGITECLSIFAGGLGILAGDHLKAASDVGIPMVGVGLLYQQGYFRQYLNAAGWQQEAYEDNDFHNLPIRPERGPDGSLLKISVDLAGRRAHAMIWSAEVGRVKLYLLDANIPDNAPEERDITDQLYGGDIEMRIRQEILLGIGGYRALQALGLKPNVYHMNEGHSAFLALEHLRHISATYDLTFDQARQAASANLVFTSHTPVPAGHDYFPPPLMHTYFGEYVHTLGIPWQEFLALGQQDPSNEGESFCMTVLALRFAAASNGVSELHGHITRRMWRHLWPGLPEAEVPIGHVTNGVHFRSWVSYEMNQLYDRYLGPKWREEPADATLWDRIETVPAEELWRTHERRRERLVGFARKRLRMQLLQRGAAHSEVDAADEALNPEALTIGFARRFASYKRATLLLHDPDRLLRMLGDPERPVQILYAGKAHPRDEKGKELISQLVALCRDERFRSRVVFLEDYDMTVARYLVEGCDVWLNTPRRPLEASGTSGMKALANGVLNISILDGWWDEAWRNAKGCTDPPGWAIGNGEEYVDEEVQDQVEAGALYDLLERDVVPLYYKRGKDGIPRQWVGRMKSSVRHLCPQFNMQRQIRHYAEVFYLRAHSRFASLTAGRAERARDLAAWLQRVQSNWSGVAIQSVEGPADDLAVGARVSASAHLTLPGLTPDDVLVELVVGRLDKQGEMTETTAFAMLPVSRSADGWIFQSHAPGCPASGLHGYTVRVMPSNPGLNTCCLPGLITWANGSASSGASA
jgi:starch phosphorylase